MRVDGIQSSALKMSAVQPHMDTSVKSGAEGMPKVQEPLLEYTQETWPITRNGRKEHDKAVVKLCERLRKDGYRIVILRYTPDAVAVKDGRLIAIEVLKRSSKGKVKIKREEYKEFDEIVFEFFGEDNRTDYMRDYMRAHNYMRDYMRDYMRNRYHNDQTFRTRKLEAQKRCRIRKKAR